MKTYWDSSALVEATENAELRIRLHDQNGITRTHALAEVFACLTGNPERRMDHESAVEAVKNLAADLDFTDLSSAEVIAALSQARKKGVRGGHVHDLLHAVAADKAGAQELLTLDGNDFRGLPEKARIIEI